MRAERGPTWTRSPPSTDWLRWLLVIAVVFALGWSAREWSQRRKATPARAVLHQTAPDALPTAPWRPSGGAAPTHSEPSFADPPRTMSVAKCVEGGRTAYGDRACASGRSGTLTVDAGTRPDAPAQGLTAYQSEMLRSADARIARDAERARVEQLAMQRSFAASTTECEAIRAAIRSLDAVARQPQSGATQDALRRERMQLMSRSAALRC